MIIQFRTLEEKLHEILLTYGFPSGQSAQIAKIFAESTLDGVFSHGINRFPRFIGDVKDGIVVPGAEPDRIQQFSAFEQWDGRQGAGISNALFSTDRSMELALEFGIGCIGLRNTNHWMRGGSYGWRAAEKGFLFLGWTNTIPNMPPWGGTRAALGNNPFIMAIPRSQEHVVLDMAMSQYSYGKLEWHKRTGKDLNEYGGYGPDNALTKDPDKILQSQRILPAGLWKGSALALVLDLAAGILAGGNTSKQVGELGSESNLSQVFIAIDIDRHLSPDQREELLQESLSFLREQNPDARYPGQRSKEERERQLEHGIALPDELWSEILKLR
jgi:3-dehydro-L-gulonate 2-dehydrogenase